MSDMELVIRTRGLTKDFGRLRAVDRLDLDIPRGTVCGFLGRNGSGKTTTIKMLAGLLQATEAGGTVLGRPIGSLDEETMSRIGYVSQTTQIYPWMTIDEIALFCASLNRHWDWAYFKHLRGFLNLRTEQKLAEMSAGMRVKVLLLLALAPRPELLLFDEPAAGLDTIARRDFVDSLIDVVHQEKTTIFFSSHILSDVERIVDHVIFLDAGRIFISDSMDHLKETVKRIQIVFDTTVPADFALPNTLRRRQEGHVVTLTVGGFTPGLVEEITKKYNVPAHVFDIGLEDLFIDLLEDLNQPADAAVGGVR